MFTEKQREILEYCDFNYYPEDNFYYYSDSEISEIISLNEDGTYFLEVFDRSDNDDDRSKVNESAKTWEEIVDFFKIHLDDFE